MEEEHESETELLDALGSCVTTVLRLYGVSGGGRPGWALVCTAASTGVGACVTAALRLYGASGGGRPGGARLRRGAVGGLQSSTPSPALTAPLLPFSPAWPQDAALPLVETLMPHVSRLLEKGRFSGAPGGAWRATARQAPPRGGRQAGLREAG